MFFMNKDLGSLPLKQLLFEGYLSYLFTIFFKQPIYLISKLLSKT